MKKFNIFKIVQLSILAVICLFSIFFLMKPDVKQFIFSSSSATTLFVVIWIILIASFIFLLIDFTLISSIKLNYHNLYDVAYADPLSGIPNRFSCDTIIEKYHDAPLPFDIGCIMIDLTDLSTVNARHGHAAGNALLKDFSGILSAASLSLCFIGRNGGNKFLAIFENCTQKKLHAFLARVEGRVKNHNQSPDSIAIEYKIGTAFNSEEHLDNITDLIALANKRIYENS